MVTDVRAVADVIHDVLKGMKFPGHFLLARSPKALVELRGSSFPFPIGPVLVLDPLEQRGRHVPRDGRACLELGALENVQDGGLDEGVLPTRLEQKCRGRGQPLDSVDSHEEAAIFHGQGR